MAAILGARSGSPLPATLGWAARLLVLDQYRVRQIVLVSSFAPQPPPLPTPPPPPPFVAVFNRMDHAPWYGGAGGGIESKGGSEINGYGYAFLNSAGKVRRVGSDNGIDQSGQAGCPSCGLWDAPTDAGYSNIYANQAGWVAVKPDGTLFCFGSKQFGNSASCPGATMMRLIATCRLVVTSCMIADVFTKATDEATFFRMKIAATPSPWPT